MSSSEASISTTRLAALPIPGVTAPIIIRIGVTGHRAFAVDSSLAGPDRARLESVAVAQIRRRVRIILDSLNSTLADTPHSFVVVSPLAEGADQVLADEILAAEGQAAQLQFVLPMPETDYVAQFASPEAGDSFRRLKALAVNPSTTALVSDGTTKAARSLAYSRVATTVAESCDILIAAWDGCENAKRAGTAATVSEAKRLGKPIFHIVMSRHPGPWKRAFAHLPRLVAAAENCIGVLTRQAILRFGSSLPMRALRISVIDGLNPVMESLRHLNIYNHDLFATQLIGPRPLSIADPQHIQTEVRTAYAELSRSIVDHATMEYFEATFSVDLHHLFLPIQRQTSRLARHYQKLYNRFVGTAVYLLSAAAVCTASMIQVFAPHRNGLFWIEVVEITSILLCLLAAKRGEWHRKRVDYRTLAERLRASVYLYIVGIRPEHSAPPAYFGSLKHPDQWIQMIVGALTRHLGTTAPWPDLYFEPMKHFVLASWIGDQIQFYQKRAREQHSRHRSLEAASIMTFGLTLLIALCHAFGIGHESPWMPVLNVATSALPAIGAAFAGILVHREYQRTALRYAEMAKALTSLSSEAEEAEDHDALRHKLSEAHHLMVREQQSWRMTIGIPPPSPA
jgi:hypothetical protein